MERYNPLDRIDVGLIHYLEKRKKDAEARLTGGVPDYSYALDYELRQKMRQIPGFERICRYITNTVTVQQIHITNLEGIAVGPEQFPEIYQMGMECARILGIGIPNIFIINNTEINAWTYAADDAAPMIVITSAMLERMTPGELKAVIGHECGHIHNKHAVYKTVIRYVMSAKTNTIGGILLTGTALAAMKAWDRASEVTADRAALICADDFRDAVSVDEKLLYGAAFGKHTVNIEALRRQLEVIQSNPTQILELLNTHPGGIRRIVADMEFIECEILYRWRPDKKQPGQIMRSKRETDDRCKKYVSVLVK